MSSGPGEVDGDVDVDAVSTTLGRAARMERIRGTLAAELRKLGHRPAL